MASVTRRSPVSGGAQGVRSITARGKLRIVMSSFIATLQIFLLLPALPLALLSHRTPRARRSRHGSYLAAASLLALGATMGALISLSQSWPTSMTSIPC